MVAKSGHHLLHEEAISSLKALLIPLATIITPNIPEAEVIIGKNIHTINDMRNAAKEIVEVYGAKAAVIKGGHMQVEARDILYYNGEIKEFSSARYNTVNTHGTGCTFSAVITAELAKNNSIEDSVKTGKEFISQAIQKTLNLGKGQGPTNHFAYNEKNK